MATLGQITSEAYVDKQFALEAIATMQEWMVKGVTPDYYLLDEIESFAPGFREEYIEKCCYKDKNGDLTEKPLTGPLENWIAEKLAKLLKEIGQ